MLLQIDQYYSCFGLSKERSERNPALDGIPKESL